MKKNFIVIFSITFTIFAAYTPFLIATLFEDLVENNERKIPVFIPEKYARTNYEFDYNFNILNHSGMIYNAAYSSPEKINSGLLLFNNMEKNSKHKLGNNLELTDDKQKSMVSLHKSSFIPVSNLYLFKSEWSIPENTSVDIKNEKSFKIPVLPDEPYAVKITDELTILILFSAFYGIIKVIFRK